jgi:hypothetical protein
VEALSGVPEPAAGCPAGMNAMVRHWYIVPCITVSVRYWHGVRTTTLLA